jgi:uncharacterized protein with PQ loop repeat
MAEDKEKVKFGEWCKGVIEDMKDPKVAIGYVGSIMLALCGAPQAWDCIVTGQANISTGTVALWAGGEILTIIYLVWSKIMTKPLAVNYGCNMLFLIIIMYYKIFPTGVI